MEEPLEKHRKDMAGLAFVLVAAAAFRLFYMHQMTLPYIDPFRHLALIRNIQLGRGFSILDSQPYIWHAPFWYYFAAGVSSLIGLHAAVFLVSVLPVPFFHLFLLKTLRERSGAMAGAVMLAVFGPAIMFSCVYGADGFSLLLFILGLWLAASIKSRRAAFLCGLLFGVAVAGRITFIVGLFLFPPLVGWKRTGWFMLGLCLPLAASWEFNRMIIQGYPYVFTQDGMAVKRSDFNLLSSFCILLQRDVSALASYVSKPYDFFQLYAPGLIPRTNWEIVGFMIAGVFTVIASRRWDLVLALGACFFTHMVFQDNRSLPFRHYLVIFPVFFIAGASICDNLDSRWPKAAVAVGAAMVLLVLWSGRACLTPVEQSTVYGGPAMGDFMAEDRYIVNFHWQSPEEYAYRFPDKNFIGMPMRPEDFDDFRRCFPEYRHVLFKDCGLTPEWAYYFADLVAAGRCTVVRRGFDSHCLYQILLLTQERQGSAF